MELKLGYLSFLIGLLLLLIVPYGIEIIRKSIAKVIRGDY